MLAGCYRRHAPPEGSPPDAGPVARPDAGRPGRDAGPPDAGAPDAGRPDAGRPDAGPIPTVDAGPPPPCAVDVVPVRATRFCALTPTGTLPSGEPTSIPVAISGCFCEAALGCAGRIVEPGVLALDSVLCPDEDECERCASFLESRCAVPPLTPGTWEVRLSGFPAAVVEAAPRMRADPARPRCWNAAPADLECSWPPAPLRPTAATVCHPSVADVGSQPAIVIELECAECGFASGGCEVELAGSEILVRPLERACPVDECDPECRTTTLVCQPPPLAAREYEIVLEGAPRSPLSVADIPPGTPRPEVCLSWGG